LRNALKPEIVSEANYLLCDGRGKGQYGRSNWNRFAKRITTRMLRKVHKQECAVGLHEYEEDIRLDHEMVDHDLVSELAYQARLDREYEERMYWRDLMEDHDDYNDRSFGPEYDFDPYYDEVA
jgi:HD superfamily phosphohydrolase